MPFTDEGEGLGNVVKPVSAIDVDTHAARDAEFGQRCEVAWPLLDSQHPEPTARDQPCGRADREHAQRRGYGSADAPVAAARRERSAKPPLSRRLSP